MADKLVIDCSTGELTEQNFTPEELQAMQPKLADVQRIKIQEITSAYLSELNSTFTSSATGTALIYDYRLVNDYGQNSQELWKELKDSIDAGYLPDTSFPVNITLADHTVVPHTKAQLQQIFGEIAARKLQLYGKLQSLATATGSIMKATTIEEVQAITW